MSMTIDKVIEILDSRKSPETEQDFEDFDTAIETAINILKAHPDKQPNEPLTLEELRKMGGEAVWISPVKENGEVPARWMIVSGYTRKEIYLFEPSIHIMQCYDRKSYGKTWLAYRRKPEEGETWQQ